MVNRFCSDFRLEVPIVQAAMGGATSPQLAAAVSNAGGLGMLALGWSPPEAARAEIRATRALTQRPFGVNLVLTQPQEERLAICIEEGVPVVSLFWGDAGALTATARAAGLKVIHTVASAEGGLRAAAAGADAVVAQGWEAGGHVYGTVATVALVPAVVDSVGGLPVLAAGGIADGRGLAAALALGAAGAWIGTRFLASEEAAIHPAYRQRLLAARETDTVYGTLFDVGWPDAPHRSLRNTTTEGWERAGRPAPGARPREGEAIGRSPFGDILAYQSHTPRAADEGEIEAMALWAGQGVGLVDRVQPAADIVRTIASEARAILARLSAEPL
jgi:NAD(P)H-dependent flavin oxidoreductase YrpB (nitropropane dioxygenase family)